VPRDVGEVMVRRSETRNVEVARLEAKANEGDRRRDTGGFGSETLYGSSRKDHFCENVTFARMTVRNRSTRLLAGFTARPDVTFSSLRLFLGVTYLFFLLDSHAR